MQDSASYERRLNVHISGDLALFTRPEFKVERISYDFITPSAARGCLEAVLWKPQFRWHIETLTVLRPIRFLSIVKNEVASKARLPFRSWDRRGEGPFSYATQERTQRHNLFLRDVAYVVSATIHLTDRAGPEDTEQKYRAMFRRRAIRGQHFHQPYLGVRDCPAEVRLATAADVAHKSLIGDVKHFGWMLHDILHGPEGRREARFFRAIMNDGVVSVPDLDGPSSPS